MTAFAYDAPMSYLRMGQNGSGVYVFMHSDGYLACWRCSFLGELPAGHYGFEAHGTQEMISHLREHAEAGDCVPGFEDVTALLLAHDAENFPHRSTWPMTDQPDAGYTTWCAAADDQVTAPSGPTCDQRHTAVSPVRSLSSTSPTVTGASPVTTVTGTCAAGSASCPDMAPSGPISAEPAAVADGPNRDR